MTCLEDLRPCATFSDKLCVSRNLVFEADRMIFPIPASQDIEQDVNLMDA